MSDILSKYLEGKIVSRMILCSATYYKPSSLAVPQDFEGQKTVEQLSRNTLIVATVCRLLFWQEYKLIVWFRLFRS